MPQKIEAALPKVASLQRDICEIQSCLNNVATAKRLINELGLTRETIRVLNADGGFASLLGNKQTTTEAEVMAKLDEQKLALLDAYTDKMIEACTALEEFGIADCSGMIGADIAATEGFWRKLQYNFTSDFKCGTKIDSLIGKLKSYNANEATAFLQTKMDYRAQPKKEILAMLTFAKAVTDWTNAHIEDLKKVAGGFFVGSKSKQAARNTLRAMRTNLEAKVGSAGDYQNLADGRNRSGVKLSKKQTLAALGYNKNDIASIATKFRQECSGSLKALKKLRDITSSVSFETSAAPTIDTGGNVGVMISTSIIGYMAPVLQFVETAVDVYKYVDYFLFYLNKEAK